MMRIVFWGNYLTFHQAAYVRALAERGDVDVKWAVEEILPPELERRGYPVPCAGRAEVIVSPSLGMIDRLLAEAPSTSVHAFLGYSRMKLSALAFRRSLKVSTHRLLLSENRYEGGLKLPFRWAIYRFHALRFRRYIDALLCIGSEGRRGGRVWFKSCGFDEAKIYPFVYTAQDTPRSPRLIQDAGDKLVFVGQLTRRKGLDLLLRALVQLKQESLVSLTVIGSGPDELRLRRMADDLGLGEIVTFLGNRDNGEVNDLIAAHDVLVLPSRFDGWGVVVNEAFANGVPVVCSDRVGAAELVAASGFGAVFTSGNVERLVPAIRATLQISKDRSKCDEFATYPMRLSGESVAQYLIGVVQHIRGGEVPRAPWLADRRKAESHVRPSVAVVYHFFPHYRGGVIRELSRRPAETVFFGASDGLDGIPAHRFETSQSFVHVATFHIGKFVLQPYVLWLCAVGKFDAFIFLANPNHITTWIGAFLSRLRGRQVVFWGHGFKSDGPTIRNRVRKMFFRLASSFFTYGWRAKENAIRLGFNPESVFIGYNSLSYEDQLVLRKELDASWSPTARSGNSLKILCISRLIPQCQYELVLQAVAGLLRRRAVDVSILFVGDGPEKGRLQRMAIELGLSAAFAGALYDEQQVSRIVHGSDVTVSPGKVGLTAIHSLMYGTPVITNSDFVSQMPEAEAVVPGITGLLFERGSASDLENKLMDFVDQFGDRQLTRARCYRVVDSLYNPRRQAEIMESAIIGEAARERGDQLAEILSAVGNRYGA